MEAAGRTMEISISLVLPITSAIKDTETVKLIATVAGDCSAERTIAGESSGRGLLTEASGTTRTTAAPTTGTSATRPICSRPGGTLAVDQTIHVRSSTETAIRM